MKPNARKQESAWVCYRQWDQLKVFYVTETPGNGGEDWGYSLNPTDAVLLNTYWMRRFKADCARVGSVGLCYAS